MSSTLPIEMSSLVVVAVHRHIMTSQPREYFWVYDYLHGGTMQAMSAMSSRARRHVYLIPFPGHWRSHEMMGTHLID